MWNRRRDTFESQLRTILEGREDWTVASSSVLVCPHGHRIELDGECPDGCTSPVKSMGLI